jgi:leucyl/phenylalanyl-tRNA--protein transferase
MGTWITADMMKAYMAMHEEGYAHSVEVVAKQRISRWTLRYRYGRIFTGESMFAKESNASKVAFVHLAKHLEARNFEWIDCQQDTPHLRSMGAWLVEENDFYADPSIQSKGSVAIRDQTILNNRIFLLN